MKLHPRLLVLVLFLELWGFWMQHKKCPSSVKVSAKNFVRFIKLHCEVQALQIKTKHKNLFSTLLPASQALLGNIEKLEITLPVYLPFMACRDMYFTLKVLCVWDQH